MAKAKKTKTTDAQDTRGIPGGWTVNPDPKPSKAKKAQLPNVIKVEHPVELNSYKRNVLALAAMAKKLQGQGTMPIIGPRLQAVLDASEKRTKKGTKKEAKKEAKASNESQD